MTDPTPDEVRTAILAAADAINSVNGILPIIVGFPLMQADGKLRVAMAAVDVWEKQLRHQAIEQKEQVPE